LHDSDDRLADTEKKLDLIDYAIHDELWLKWRETKQRLERIGFDVSRYRPPPRSPSRSAHHLRADDDVERLVVDAQRSARPALDRLYEQHVASRDKHDHDRAELLRRPSGEVLGVR
jgi:hypothetical protein